MVVISIREVCSKPLHKDKAINSANHIFQHDLHLVDREITQTIFNRIQITDNSLIQMWSLRIPQITIANLKLTCLQNNCSLSPWMLEQMALIHQGIILSSLSLELKRYLDLSIRSRWWGLGVWRGIHHNKPIHWKQQIQRQTLDNQANPSQRCLNHVETNQIKGRYKIKVVFKIKINKRIITTQLTISFLALLQVVGAFQFQNTPSQRNIRHQYLFTNVDLAAESSMKRHIKSIPKYARKYLFKREKNSIRKHRESLLQSNPGC